MTYTVAVLFYSGMHASGPYRSEKHAEDVAKLYRSQFGVTVLLLINEPITG